MRFCHFVKTGVFIVVVTFVSILPAKGQTKTTTDTDFANNKRICDDVTRGIVEPVSTQETDTADQSIPKSKQLAARENVHHNGPAVTQTSSAKTATADVKTRTTKTAPDDSNWQFEITPYLYATGIRGPVEARGRRLDLDASFAKLFDSLDFTIAGSIEARKKRFVSLNDVIWYKLSNTRDTPGGLYGSAKIGINLVIIDPEAGYRLFKTKAASLDILGGARIWSLEANLNTTAGRLEGFEASQRKTWAAPVIGVRGRIDVTSKWLLEGKFDIGGGLGADLTTQVYAGGGYKFTPHFAAIAGYRYLQVDYDDSKGFLFDTKMNGVVVGLRFSF